MSDSREHSNILWPVLFFIVSAVAGYLAWLHFGGKKMPEENNVAEKTLAAAPLVEREVSVEKNYIGYVVPVNDVAVRPYISGFVASVEATGGAEVKSGEVLLTIDQAPYKARLAAAQAAVAGAEATLNNSSLYYERLQKAGTKAVSPTDKDNAKASYLSAKAALQQARAELTEAEVNLGYTLVKATINGVVGNVSLSVGDYVSPEDTLLTVIQYNPMRVVFSITGKDYLDEEMFAGENIRLRLANGSIYEQKGEFRYADNQMDKATDSIAVYADFANPDKKLLANAYVNVVVEKKYRGMVVAKNLVYPEADGNYIYVAGSGGVIKTKVDILSEYGNNNYILKNNFRPGESIVIGKIGAGATKGPFKIVVSKSSAAEEKN